MCQTTAGVLFHENFVKSIVQRIWILVISLSALLHFGVEAQPNSESLSYQKYFWYDDSGQATLEEAKKAKFKPYQGVLAQGYFPGNTWIKIHVESRDHHDSVKGLVIRIRPAYLDQITLYDPANDSYVRFTGDNVKRPEYLILPTNLGFRLANIDHGRDIYLKLNSTSTHLIDVELMTQDEFDIANSFQTFWHGLFFGVMGFILLWALYTWLDKHDSLCGMFFLKHLCVLVYALGYLGYMVYVVEPGTGIVNPDAIFSYSIFFVVVVSLRFQIGVLEEYGLCGWRFNFFKMLFLVPITAFVLALADQMQHALRLTALLTVITPLSLFLVVLLTPTRALSKKNRIHELLKILPSIPSTNNEILDKIARLSPPLSKPVLLFYYGILILVLVAAALQTLGIMQGGPVVLHALLVQSLISSVLILFLLLYRSRILQRQQSELAKQMARAQGELAAQRLAQDDQAHMVEMLGHEIKTPLSVLQFAIDEWIKNPKERAKVNESIDQIRVVTDRSVDAIRQSIPELKFEAIDLVAVIRKQVSETQRPEKIIISTPESAIIHANPMLVEQILSNLIDNALKYGAESADIQITIRFSLNESFGKKRDGFEILIANHIGKAGAPDPEMIFKKYYRTEGAKAKPGTGLGLYLVLSFTKFLNGTIDYRLNNNKVEFVIWLPVKKF